MDEGKPIRKRGRPPLLQEESLKSLSERLESDTRVGDGWSPTKFKAEVVALMRKEAEAAGRNALAVEAPSDGTLRKLRTQLNVSVIDRPSTQTHRRKFVSLMMFVVFV